MIERAAVGWRGRVWFGALLVGFALAGCTKAHDVDATGGGPRDGGPDDEEGHGNAGSGDDDNGGSGGSGGSSTAGSGGASAGSGGGGALPIFGNTNLCSPCSDSMGMAGTLEA